MPDWLITLGVVGGITLLSVAGFLVLRRVVPVERLRPNNEIGGFIHAAVGVVYAVIAAFIVSVVWEQFNDADATVRHETGEIAELYNDARLLPDSISAPLRSAVRDYIHSIVEDEWPLLAEEKESHTTTRALLRIRTSATAFKPAGDYQLSIFTRVLDDIDEVATDRNTRLLNSEQSVHGLMWALLIGGGVITLAFAFAFGSESVTAHAVMIGALAAVLAIVLYLIAALEHPFRGIIRVDAEPFVHLLNEMQ